MRELPRAHFNFNLGSEVEVFLAVVLLISPI